MLYNKNYMKSQSNDFKSRIRDRFCQNLISRKLWCHAYVNQKASKSEGWKEREYDFWMQNHLVYFSNNLNLSALSSYERAKGF